VQPFLRGLQHGIARRVLRAELLVHADDSPLRLNGSGMVVLNAPWNLDETLREPLRVLARLLGQGQPARWQLDWLANDSAEAPAAPRRPAPRSGRPR
jgi:23S rRNA (adenine2030-N6)-methyltransferase